MTHALALARRALGRAAPNPAVGCVIINKEGVVVGCGWTADGGRPHAETQALKQAGLEAKGGTAWVTLEPCCHHGQTPPCTQGLIDAGIKRVVASCADPDPRVSGKGFEALRNAGVEVETGILESEAQELNRGFFLRIMENRPLVTLKTATSADGKIAPEPGKRQAITGELAQRRVHLERSFHDAILVGVGTVLADDPLLTTRLEGYEHSPVRVVFDTQLRTPPESILAKTARDVPLFIFHASGNRDRAAALEGKGARLFAADPRNLKEVLGILAQEGMTRLFVEGGAMIHASFLEAGYCDAFLRFRAPAVIGPKGVDALAGHDIESLESRFGLRKQESVRLGEDLLEIYAKPA